MSAVTPMDFCPNCKEKLVTIDGTLTRWKTCPKCKYTKLENKASRSPVNVRSLR